MGVSKNSGKKTKWMVKIMENPMNKWMIWGVFPLFLEGHPYPNHFRQLNFTSLSPQPPNLLIISIPRDPITSLVFSPETTSHKSHPAVSWEPKGPNPLNATPPPQEIAGLIFRDYENPLVSLHLGTVNIFKPLGIRSWLTLPENGDSWNLNTKSVSFR